MSSRNLYLIVLQFALVIGVIVTHVVSYRNELSSLIIILLVLQLVVSSDLLYIYYKDSRNSNSRKRTTKI